MKLHLVTHGIDLTPELREHVRRRVQFALGRFAPRIERVSVQLADANGPRGGVDKCCSIRVYSRAAAAPVIVRERQESLHAAVALAAGRVERGVERKLRLAARSRGPAPRSPLTPVLAPA